MLTKEELNQMVEAEAERLGVGNPEFLRQHQEFMAEIEQLLEESRQRRAARQMLGAKDVMAALGVSESKAYGYIRQMNIELEEKGYITVRGKVPAKYFQERFYGGMERGVL